MVLVLGFAVLLRHLNSQAKLSLSYSTGPGGLGSPF